MKVKPRFQDPEKVSLSPEQKCPFERGNKYKEYVNIFLKANFVPCMEVSLEKRCAKGDRGSTVLCY